ncbi:MAG: hypothetical protein V1841_01035 [Patescibacteria group bacterium]
MSSIKGLDASGPLLFLGLLGLVGALLGLVQGTQCGFLRCSLLFLILGVFFLFWGIEEAI